MSFTVRLVSAPAARPEPSNVRPLAAAATRSCSRPGCPSPATATAFLDYPGRSVMLTPLTETPEEHAYDLCVSHATKTSPPRGWLLQDRRPDLQPTGQPVDPEFLASADTVAVLARALRAVPDGADGLASLSRVLDPIEEVGAALDGAVDGVDWDVETTATSSAATDADAEQEQAALEW
ncbi:MAG: DUF3499 family protein [Nitriliruptorales bacterium]|nr:DUF3499 family protein [Nitriliruptorales bacterium]